MATRYARLVTPASDPSRVPPDRAPRGRYDDGVGIFGGGGTQTVQDERTDVRPEDGDHERFSHYVPKDKLTEAMVNGTPCIALCGKVWVPSRDPQRFPVCPACKEVWSKMSGDDGADSGSDE